MEVLFLNSYLEEILRDILRSCMDSLSYWDMWWSTRQKRIKQMIGIPLPVSYGQKVYTLYVISYVTSLLLEKEISVDILLEGKNHKLILDQGYVWRQQVDEESIEIEPGLLSRLTQIIESRWPGKLK